MRMRLSGSQNPFGVGHTSSDHKWTMQVPIFWKVILQKSPAANEGSKASPKELLSPVLVFAHRSPSPLTHWKVRQCPVTGFAMFWGMWHGKPTAFGPLCSTEQVASG